MKFLKSNTYPSHLNSKENFIHPTIFLAGRVLAYYLHIFKLKVGFFFVYNAASVQELIVTVHFGLGPFLWIIMIIRTTKSHLAFD